jgi:hypothetical protein
MRKANSYFINLLYKCPELKSKDFKPQEKRERKIYKTMGMRGCVCGADWQKEKIERESKKERKKESKKERK